MKSTHAGCDGVGYGGVPKPKWMMGMKSTHAGCGAIGNRESDRWKKMKGQYFSSDGAKSAARGVCLRGQYFSFDAIVASVIFMLGMSLLLGQWFSVKQSTDLTNDYLQESAFRASDILVSAGVPDDWFDENKLPGLVGVRKVGVGTGAQGALLNRTVLDALYDPYSNGLWYDPATGVPTPYYNAFRTMLGAGSHIYVIAASTEISPNNCFQGRCYPVYWRSFGFLLPGANDAATEYVHVRRIVAFEDQRSPGRLMAGTMDIHVYKNASIR